MVSDTILKHLPWDRTHAIATFILEMGLHQEYLEQLDGGYYDQAE